VPKGWGALSRIARIAIVALAILLVSESVVRLRASALPPPLKWATPDLDRKVQQLGEMTDGTSVLFLGSSTVDGSIDPSLMTLDDDVAKGRPSFNAAVRGGTIRMVSSWARLKAVPLARPDVVVLGVASRELNANDPRQQAREDEFFDAPAVRHLTGDETPLDAAERAAESASALFKYRTVIREPASLKAFVGLGETPSITDTVFGDYIAPDGQFLSFLRRPYNAAVFLRDELNEGAVDAGQLATFRELVGYLKSKAKRVIVVNMPVTKDYVTSLGDHDRFAKLMRTEVDRLDVGYVRPGIWPTTLFADPVHVNRQGSAKLTKLIEDVIERTARTGSR
jgi:hypothetical protein